MDAKMLPAPHRLRAEREIQLVMSKGKYASTPLLLVRVLARDQGKTRATVVAGLKVHKRATERNLVKRRIRESLRVLLPEMKAGLDLVVVARSGAVGKSFQDLGNDLYGALVKLGVIHR